MEIKNMIDNLRLSEKEYKEGKLVLDSMPSELDLQLNYSCNLGCHFCPQWNTKRNRVLSREAIDKVLPLVPYLRVLLLHGGEAIMGPHFEYIISTVERESKYPIIRMITNGIMLNDDKYMDICLSPAFGEIFVSLDGGSRESYMAVHGGQDRFDEVVNGVRKLCRFRGYGPRVILKMMATKETCYEVEKFFDLAVSLGVDGVQFSQFYKSGKPGFYDKHKPSDKDIVHYFNDVEKCIDRHKLDVRVFNINGHVDRALELRRKKKYKIRSPEGFWAGLENNGCTRGICHFPWSRFTVKINGDVCVCCQSEKMIGNLCRSSFEEIWNSKDAQIVRSAILRRDFVTPSCRKQCGFQDGKSFK